MTSAQQLIDMVEMRGVDLWVENGKLRFRAPNGAFAPELREQISARRDEVIALLSDREAPVADPDNAHEPFPLTDVQAAYLVGRTDAYQDGGVGCHGYAEFAIPGDLAESADQLHEAWQRVVDCHEMLRVTISPDGWQRIDPGMDVPLVVRDCPTAAAFDDTRRTVRSRLRHHTYELGAGPMIDIAVTRGPDQAFLHLSVDLILTDFRGIEVILRDFETALTEPAKPLPQPSISFRDYILTMRKRARTASARATREQDEQYWQERGERLPSAMRFPSSTGENREIAYSRRSHVVVPHTWARLTGAAQERGVTPSALLLAVLGRVARRYTDVDTSLVTATVLERSPVVDDVDRLVGDFTSTALVEAPGSSAMTFAELAHRAQDSLFEAIDHSGISGVEVGRMRARRHGWQSFTPQVVLTSTVGVDTEADRRLRPIVEAGLSQTPQVLLDVQAAPHDGGASLVWDSRDGGIDEHVLDAAFDDFVRAVELLAADESAWDCDVLARRTLPGIPRSRRRSQTALHTRILEHAEADPDAVAIVHSGGTVSRGELAARARAVTRTLADAGVRPASPVVVALPPGPDQVAAEIGVLAAGCHFVPVDTEWPAARREHVIATLTDDAPVFVIDENTALSSGHVDTAVADTAGVDPDQLAYVIFTSGSTGTPKGVALTHAQVATTLDEMGTRLRLGADDAVLAISRHSFDLSVFNVFGMLAAGARVVLPSCGVAADPQTWAREVAEHGVTIWNSVPEQLQLLLDHLDDEGADALAGLRAVLVSGDWVPVRQPEHLWRHNPGARFLALGGATEAAIWSNAHEVPEPLPVDARSVPYGRALPNQGMWVLNADGEPAAIGQIGEIHIAGDGVGAGYIGADSAAFYRHPDNGERCYRTGDQGRLMPDGEIEFLGRVDGQVKIRGHRIELAEVESALSAGQGVASAVATPLDTGTSKILVAAVVAQRGSAQRAAGVEAAEKVERAVAAEHDSFSARVDTDRFADFLHRMQSVALDAMGSKIAEQCARGTTDVEQIVAALGGAGHESLVRRWIRTQRDHARLVIEDGLITTAPDRHDDATLLRRWAEVRELGRALDYGDEQLDYVERCLAELSGLLRGEVDPLNLLFPEGRTDVARAAYGENLTARYLNQLICAGLRERAEQRNAEGQALRVLEIGAGVGGTTAPVLAALEDCRVEYTFTDVSRFFLDEAVQRWPQLDVMRFDLSEDPQAQGIAPGSYDVVLCANVLHNAQNIPAALDRLHGLLAPGGTLAAIDATMINPPLLISMEFKEGLTEFTDQRVGTGDAFFSLAQWGEAFENSKFDRFTHFPKEDSVLRPIAQSVFVASARLDEAPTTPAQVLEAGARQLPHYMVPSRVVVLPSLPLTANGKVDRSGIAELIGRISTSTENRVGAGEAGQLDAEHATVAEIWRAVLGLGADHPITADDNFFALGGDSLLIARCVGKLRREIPGASEMPWDRLLREIVADPTVAGCVRALTAPEPDAGADSHTGQQPLVEVLDGSGDRWRHDAVILVHDGSGGISPYRDLIAQLALRSERPRVLGVQRTPGDDYLSTPPEKLFDTLADRYVRALDERWPDQEFDRVHVVGYCMGGLIAASMAERLAERGAPVGSVTVVSSYRIPFVIEDALLLDYSFAKLMYRDPADAGLDFDEHELGALLNESRARHGDRVPEGAVAGLAGGFPKLASAVPTAPADTRTRLARLADSDPAGEWTVEALLELRETYVASLKAVAAFNHPGYFGDITFLRQRGELHFLPTLQEDMTAFWSAYCLGELEVTDVDGTHFDCLVGDAADQVVDVLERVWGNNE